MKEIALCASLTTLTIVIDLIKKNIKDWFTYFYFFCMLLVASLFFKSFGIAQEVDYNIKAHYRFEDAGVVKEFKFVPPGVPDSHVNEDNSVSEKAKKYIRATNQQMAKFNREKNHQQWEIYKDKWEKLCWAVPDCTHRRLLTAAFEASVGASLCGPDPRVKLAVIFAVLVGHIGNLYIDNWYEIIDTANMCDWHGLVELEYQAHMRDKGWS